MLWKTGLLLLGAQTVFAKCKCTPGDDCWPSASAWKALNTSVDGHLIRNQPLAESCYPGPGYDLDACEKISDEWKNSSYISQDPLGYSYPLFNACPAINTTVADYPPCDLGNQPVYTINATKPQDVTAGINFAKENDIRLVIKNTGHDIVGRSQGYGSLMVWIRNLRTGVEYHESYRSASGCPSNWTGSAFTVGGGYVWGELYEEATKRSRVVIGGNDPTVGAIGGYLQGAGHGPLTHQYGLATDQVLEMDVVLVSGELVTASPCQHPDLFKALRGGGGGTYGVVVAMTIKAHPTNPMLSHSFSVVPINATLERLLDVTAYIISKYPALNDAGFSGLASAGSGALQGLSVPAVYAHTFGKVLAGGNESAVEDAKAVVNKELVDYLRPYNGTEFLVTSAFKRYDTFQEYDDTVGVAGSVGSSKTLMASRFFDKKSLANNQPALHDMIRKLFSAREDGPLDASTTLLYLCLIGGGQVLHAEPNTSVQPSWRRTYLLTEALVTWADDADAQEIQATKDDLTFRKADAMKAVARGMGGYLNEADRRDPSWKDDFFGENYAWLKSIKERYDPDQALWCYPCVGSEAWEEDTGARGYGPLCQKE